MSEEKFSPAELVERTTIADVYRADKQLGLAATKFFSSPKTCSTRELSNCAEPTTKSAN